MSPQTAQRPFGGVEEWRWLIASWVAVGLITALYAGWLDVDNPTIVALSFLLVVLVVAAASTLRVALATSVLAFLCFNFFFLSPVGTFTIDHPEDWAALLALLATSIVASQLSAQSRRRAREATDRRDELARLLDLTRDILMLTDAADPVAQVAGQVARRFGFVRATICLPAADGWICHGSDAAGGLDPRELGLALHATRSTQPVGPGGPSSRVEGRDAGSADEGLRLVPLLSGTRPIGVLALRGGTVARATLDTIAGITAIAIERTKLLEERREAEVVRRGSELKTALLASLGHDLKTPLTAVKVAAGNLTASWLTAEQREEQVAIVLGELDRLARLFQNLMDMARIEIDGVTAEREWVEPEEIVEAAASQVEHALREHELLLEAGGEGSLVHLDPRLTSAALAHVLENAAQYSPRGSGISIRVEVDPEEMRIVVRDRGPGIAAADLERVFERFYRGAAAGRHETGTGMGLAITRGLLAAQGGRAWAESAPGQGASITIAVPAPSRAVVEIEDQAS